MLQADLPADLPTERVVGGAFTRAVVTYRWWLLGLVLAVQLAAFNGQWRVGLDSSIYRGVAHNLVAGRGYVFGGQPQDLVYPGLPWLLAALELVFGPAAWPGIVVLNLMALAALACVYALIRLRFPEWVAIAVVAGVGLNEQFVQQTQELMTDIPFVLGVSASLLGWELLHRADSRGKAGRAVGLLVAGLALAASMRPTFWVLAGAWVVVCVWGLIAGPRRKVYGWSLIVLLLVWGAVLAVDPRFGGFNVFSSGYERTAMTSVQHFEEGLHREGRRLFTRHLPEAFFGEHMSPVGLLFSAALGVGVILAARRQALWGLIVAMLLFVTLLFSSTPRYFIMVLPILWLGWILLACWVAKRFGPKWQPAVMAVVIWVGVVPNVGGIASIIVEQRKPNFAKTYKHGEYVLYRQLSDDLAHLLPADAKVLGPRARIITYWADRTVRGAVEIFGDRPKATHLDLLREYGPLYAVFPKKLYEAKDDPVVDLFDRGLIVPVKTVVQRDGYYVSQVQILPVVGDWRLLPPKDKDRRRGIDPEPPATGDPKADKLRKFGAVIGTAPTAAQLQLNNEPGPKVEPANKKYGPIDGRRRR
jgi:xanthosine utilization system XapX-like protein